VFCDPGDETIVKSARVLAAIVLVVLAGCTAQPAQTPGARTSGLTTTVDTPQLVPTTPDAAAAAAAAAAASAEVARVAAAQESVRSAAESSAAAASAAQAAAEQTAAEKAAAEKAEAERLASESQAAAQSAADQAAAEASGINGWYDSAGNWISPETAARAIDNGISPGGDVPGYLRCGTICGELPTSGEVQWAWQCIAGTMTCDGIDAESVLSAAGNSEAAIAAAKEQRAASDSAVRQSDDAQKACTDGGGYMVIRGVCYATEADARLAGE